MRRRYLSRDGKHGGERHRRLVCCIFCRAEFPVGEFREHLPDCEERPPELAGRGRHKGFRLTEEHKRKDAAGHRGKKRGPMPEWWKKKIGKAHIGLTRGEKNASWRGGVTPLRNQIRLSYKTRHWRKAVFQRDNFICQHCHQNGVSLQADHYPKTFSEILEEYHIMTLDDAYACAEMWDIGNGRTLCRDCHRKTETWGGRGRGREKAA